jgi:TonB family protein
MQTMGAPRREPLFGLAVAVLLLSGLARVAAQQRPYSVEDLKSLAQAGVGEKRLVQLVRERGISFAATPDAVEQLRGNGVPESVLEEVRAQIPRGQTREFYVKEADRLLGEFHYEEAVAYYKRILEQLPNDPAAQTGVTRAEERERAAWGGEMGGRIHNYGEGGSTPQAIHLVFPKYTDAAREAELEGKVVLQIVVSIEGNVTDARVLKSLGEGLDENAIEAARATKFKPATVGGVPVPMVVEVESTFRLISPSLGTAHGSRERKW